MAVKGTVTVADGKATFTATCTFCGKPAQVTGLDPAKLELFASGQGPFVQDLFPELSADDRETLISGVHGSCFDTAFPPEDDDDDPEETRPYYADLGVTDDEVARGGDYGRYDFPNLRKDGD